MAKSRKYQEKKKEILPSPMTKPPIPTENSKTKGQHTNATKNFDHHASDKIVGILLDRSRSHDSVQITVLGLEIRIGRLIEFEAGDEQSKMADDELVAMDLS